MKKKKLNFSRHLWLLILSIVAVFQINAQNTLHISGNVKDESAEPVIGATVTVVGTTNGSITDIDGNFTLSNVPSNGNIQISFLGYVTKTIAVNNQTRIDVVLSENSEALEEVIVVGYGVQRKSDLTGAVASVRANDALNSVPASNITDALQGRISGVTILSGSGDPSSNNTIRVRGMNSVTGDQGPLVVIDGFIGGDLQALNPNDIQSIEVLKDASATAVYGSRGANGVIMVTTKNPTSEKVNVTFNTFMNWKKAPEYDDMLSPYEFAQLANDFGREFNESQGKAAHIYYDDAQLAAFKNGSAGYDYFDAIFRDPALQQNYELSLSSGGEKTSYLASLRYNKNEGTVKRNYSEIYNYRLKVDTKIKPWLKAGLNFYGSYARNSGPRLSQYYGLLASAMYFPNTLAPYDENGDYNNTLALSGGAKYNPIGLINENDKLNTTLTNYLQGYLDFRILDGLSFRTQLGITFSNSKRTETNNNKSYYYFANGTSNATAYSRDVTSWLNTNTLNYTKEFNEDHRVNATAVFEQSYSNSYWHESEARDLSLSGELGSNSLEAGKKYVASSERTISTLQSYLFRVNYVFKNRYMLTASIRGDGSSKLYDQWSWFPSAAVAWDVKQEPFMQNVSLFSQLKLRVGYGSVGNQAIPDYRIYSMMEASTSGVLNFKEGRASQKYLKWERNDQTNIGIDMGFLNGRLTLTADWYNKDTKDLLLEVEQPKHVGYGSLLKNAGGIKNRGIEVTISADPITGKDWQWHTDVTLTHNKGTFSKIPTRSKNQSLAGSYENEVVRMLEGRKVAWFWGVTYEGVWQKEQVDALFVNADGNTDGRTNGYVYGVQAGNAKYKDVNKDGKISESDAGVIGNGQPSFNWGWNNRVAYKDFDLSVFIVGFHDFDIYNVTDAIGYGGVSSASYDVVTPKKALQNRWTPTNTGSNIPGFVYEKAPYSGYSTRFVEKGDFVKMKSITLGYNFPRQLCQKWNISNLRIYGSVQNPFTITDYSGMDPEAALGTPLTQGIDWGAYPNSRNFILGLNFSF
ncbi:TonB-dependent receptor [Dysgonomonas sp. OttesenSCG-928-M03]|nr:TonB-dependent receptor [Dysgonomonas sp. OttesenSCG-928-M03]